MLLGKLCKAALLAAATIQSAAALAVGGKPHLMIRESYKRAPLQDIVTYDEVRNINYLVWKEDD